MSRIISQHTLKHEARKSKSKIISRQLNKPIFIVGFEFKFQSYCLENECKLIPIVEVQEELKDKKIEKGIPLLIAVYKPGTQDELDKLYFKNYPLLNGVLGALKKCFEDIAKITVLKLEFCHMTSEQIEFLGDILANNTTITEVSVNGNPNKQQNFDLLLKNTKLLILSLKCCSINSIGMKKISAELSKPFESTLLHLNLASNLLFDDGIDEVVSILRINRTLVSLNLADNKIYDEGCLKLMQPLQKFALELPELTIRRQIRFVLIKNELERSASATTANDTAEVNKVSNSVQNVIRSTSAKLSKSSSVKGSKRSSREKSSIYSQDSLGKKKSSKSGQNESDIGIHPFVQDSYEEDVEIYCKGNDSLINLGFAYNRITKEGLTAIIQMLHYQRNTYPNDKGISRISLEGNDLTNDCEQELLEFDDLINRRSKKSSNISNKRSSIKSTPVSLS